MERTGLNVDIKQVDDPSRVITFIGVSEQTAVRDGLFLEPRGVVLENYRRNPVFLWAHDYSQPAVGRALEVRPLEKGVEFDVEFAGKDAYPFADVVYQLYRRKFMRAVSVGWITLESERENLPEGIRRRITKWDLLELSAVPVPADAGAVSVAGLEDLDRELLARAFGDTEIRRLGERIAALEESLKRAADIKELLNRIEALEAGLAEMEGAYLEEKSKETAIQPAALSSEELAAMCRSAIDRAIARAKGRLV